jgi:hypothetical protein
MKYRKVTIFTGEPYSVPEHIRRLDSNHTHGWQLRYGKWMMFSDHSNDGSGAKAALSAATKELLKRVDVLHAPTNLRRVANASKTSNLPVGISYPMPRMRKGRRVAEHYYGVTIPRFGNTPTNTSVYVGTDNTVTDERFELALAKAITIRAYQAAATKAKRSSSRKRER